VTAVSERYQALVAAGELNPDEDQKRAVAVLDRLARDLSQGGKTGLWARLTGSAPKGARGVYMWGGVGRGKSMLMDLAFETIQTAPKRRVHFHEFMLEVHERLRKERQHEAGDPIPTLAQAIAAEAKLLCFDEMVINNSADAMILSRLFSHVPNGPEATRALSDAFFRLTDFSVEDRAKVPTEDIPVQGGRSLHVPKSLKGVAVFSFKRLCGEARGAPDYLAIARRYHTVILVGIPRLGPENRNEAARFVTLIDALYEHKVKLLAAADAQPAELYTQGTGAFEFERTASRLIEMQSQDYLARGHGVDEEPRRAA
jgi:predicted ATPase